ncbi:MAG: hypothetical protein HAW66_05915 [Shewanella sp.]|nr:hypothetical protein [Shewanella sp.]
MSAPNPLSYSSKSCALKVIDLAAKIGGETQGVAHKLGAAAAVTAIVAAGTGTGVLPSIVVGSSALAGLELLRIGVKTGLSYFVSDATAEFTANVAQFSASTASLCASGASLVRAGMTIGTVYLSKSIKDKVLPKSSRDSTSTTVVHAVTDVALGAGCAIAGNLAGQQIEEALGIESWHQHKSFQNEPTYQHGELKRRAEMSTNTTQITSARTLNGTEGNGKSFEVSGAGVVLTALGNSTEGATIVVRDGAEVMTRDNSAHSATLRAENGARIIARDNSAHSATIVARNGVIDAFGPSLRHANVTLIGDDANSSTSLSCREQACNRMQVNIRERGSLSVSADATGGNNMNVTVAGGTVNIRGTGKNLRLNATSSSGVTTTNVLFELNGGTNAVVFADGNSLIRLVNSNGGVATNGHFTISDATLRLNRDTDSTFTMLKKGTLIICNDAIIEGEHRQSGSASETIDITQNIAEHNFNLTLPLAHFVNRNGLNTDGRCNIIPESTTNATVNTLATTSIAINTTEATSTPVGSITPTPIGASTTPIGVTTTPVGATSTPVGATSTPAGSITPTPVGASSTPVEASTTPVGATSTPVRSITPTPIGASTTPIGATSTQVGVITPTPVGVTPPTITTGTTIEPVIISNRNLVIGLGVGINVGLVGLVIGCVIILVEVKQAQRLATKLKKEKQINITFKEAVIALVNAKFKSKIAFTAVVFDRSKAGGNAEVRMTPLYIPKSKIPTNERPTSTDELETGTDKRLTGGARSPAKDSELGFETEL